MSGGEGAERRCPWALGSELELEYHDHEWGTPERDDRRLFEFVVLEGAQAGLSWRTILNKREAYRSAFAGFDPEAVATFDSTDEARLLVDAGIVRNRAKVASAITNARAYLDVQAECGSFARYLWSFVDDAPVVNHWRAMADVPASTPVSEVLSKDLRRRGFRFVGPTICYALMQATGLVNDHLVTCPRHPESAAIAPGA